MGGLYLKQITCQANKTMTASIFCAAKRDFLSYCS